MIEFQSVAAPLSAALGLSLVVERFLELLQNVLEPLIVRREGRHGADVRGAVEAAKQVAELHDRDKQDLDADERATALAEERRQLQSQLENAGSEAATQELQQKLAAVEEALAKEEAATQWAEQYPPWTMLTQPATDPDRGKSLKAFVLQVLGFAAGIIAASVGDVQVFNAFFSGVDRALIFPWLDHVLTGLLIGGGSAPIHLLIRFITQRKTSVMAEPVAAAEPKPVVATGASESAAPLVSAPAVVTAPSGAAVEWVDVPYHGGVDRDKLESVHLRKKDPNLIVYHHTAMDSRGTFEDVVRVIKARKWLTGYHCVILADGSVHPFCRWDRFGNHAVGFNQRSLGIAFHGNYETNRSVPSSNWDGRYGPTRPTAIQVKAAARVVALWTAVYGIDVDFSDKIIPHKQIAKKACPGNKFPYEEFQRMVEHFRDRWEQSPLANERIAEFKLQPYLYA